MAFKPYRNLTLYEESSKINFVEMDEQFESNIQSSTAALVKDIQAMQANIVNQVRRHKIISKKRPGLLNKITVNDTKLKAHLLNYFAYTYFKGKADARKEVEASLGHRINVRGKSIFADPVDLVPAEALEEFGRRQLVSKREFSQMAARERARAFTVAGVVDKDLLNSTRLLIGKAIDQGWTLDDFSRGLREANVKYTGTAFGTDAKKGQPISPAHTETILRTNSTTIYNNGRWNMYNDPEVIQFVPAYQYSAILDNRTRDTHAAMDSRIYLRDDPIWNQWRPANGFNCFVAGTMITNKRRPRNNRPIPIENIKVGDLVLTHEGNWKPVIQLHKKHYTGILIEFKLKAGETVRCTPNHQIMTDDGWKKAEDIQLDDKIHTVQRLTRANPGIKHIEFDGYVYNLSVAGDESYIANKIVVHNCRCLLIAVTANLDFSVSAPTRLRPDKGFGGGLL